MPPGWGKEARLAIGEDATTNSSGERSIAIGSDTSVNYQQAVGIGYNADVTADYMFRLGGSAINNLKCADTTLSTTSDKNDKADFEDVNSYKSLEFIKALNPITYVRNGRGRYEKRKKDMNEEELKLLTEYGYRVYDKEAHAKQTKKGDRRQVGFIAQEVMSAIKDIYNSDNYAGIVNIEYYDQDVPEEVEKRYGLEYSRIIPLLASAMQEQQKQIEVMERENKNLLDLLISKGVLTEEDKNKL
jgi:hypothetical protein